jgi:flavorubredoxin
LKIAVAPVEVVPGRLWVLGDVIPLDGSVTWAPATGGYQPLNSYLVVAGSEALLVDTGPKLHRDVLLAQLATLLPPGRNLSVLITRAEPDCMGGLPAVAAAYQVDRIFTGGSQSPYDGLDEDPRFAAAWSRRVPLGKSVIVGLTLPGDAQLFEVCGGLEVIAPALRVLATFWAYERSSRALFTSDVFGHVNLDDASGPRVLDETMPDGTTAETLREQLLAKYFWLPKANPSAILENLRRLFGEHQVDVVAPAHGRVLRGREVVKRHFELLCEVLENAG